MNSSIEEGLVVFLSRADIQSSVTQRAAILFAIDAMRGRKLREQAINRLADAGRTELLEEVQSLLAIRRNEGGTTPTMFARNPTDVDFEKEIDGLIAQKMQEMRSRKHDSGTPKTP